MEPGTLAFANYVSWDGGFLIISRGNGVVPVHAHYATQVAFGRRPGIGFRTRDDEPWTAYHGAIIPSRQPHAMDTTQVGETAVLFVEPETPEGRAIAELYLRDDPSAIVSIPPALLEPVVPALFAAWLEERSVEAIRAAAWRVIQALTRGVRPSVASDERILRAIAYINAHLGRQITLEEVASEACLSPSRFRHLFVEETGMQLRPYILWRRFLQVWECAARGDSLSAAAHAAGFADAAHLTRTSRRMFGFPPSVMYHAAQLPLARGGEYVAPGPLVPAARQGP